MKQIIDLPTSTSTINQSDMNVSNAIYRITQDYDLNSKTIKIPQDCVLSFEGGSLNNGVLVGQSTIIKDNQFDGFFKSNLDLTGDYSVMKVIANWFDEIEAYKMFQRAFDFAYSIFEARKTYYSSSSILVTCYAKSYYISKGMRIQVGVSFNGNNASFFPKNDTWNKDDYMFRLNNKENFILTENGIDGLSHKRTDNIDTNYIPCSVYKSENNSVYAELLSNQLPPSNGWKCGDIIVLSNK